MKRKLSFTAAKANYPHRYTCEHVPAWARQANPGNGKFYAPQFETDREWYEKTRFPGEQGHHGMGSDCYTSGQTWPRGQWLDSRFTPTRARA